MISPIIGDFEDKESWAWARECRWPCPLETNKGKEIDFLPEPLKRNAACQHLELNPVRLCVTFDPQNYKIH